MFALRVRESVLTGVGGLERHLLCRGLLLTTLPYPTSPTPPSSFCPHGPCSAPTVPVLLPQPSKQKRKFSSFFKSLVIELDKDLYGPDNHLVEVRPGPHIALELPPSHRPESRSPSAAQMCLRDHPRAPTSPAQMGVM